MNLEKTDNISDQFEQLIVFQLADEYYGVDIGAVNTIIRMQEITAVPRTPTFVEGVINLRGSIIPVIDLRKRFALPISEVTKASRIVVVESNGIMIGMVVDEVVETLKISIDSIEPPSPVISSVDAQYLRGIGKQGDRLVILLDLNLILSSKEATNISKIEKKLNSKEETVKKAA